MKNPIDWRTTKHPTAKPPKAWTEADTVKWLTTGRKGSTRTPGSVYGTTVKECAVVAHRAAVAVTPTAGPLDAERLEHIMGMVVAGHSDIGRVLT